LLDILSLSLCPSPLSLLLPLLKRKKEMLGF